MRRNLPLAVALSILAAAAWADPFSLSAPPGHFDAKTLAPAAKTVRVSGSIRMLKFNGGQDWPPAAYIGFHQGSDRNQSIQLLVIRNRDTDNYLVAGYRVIEDGKETRVKSLASLPLRSVVRVSISFEHGLVTLRLNSHSPIVVRTPLTEVAPYVSVSSGTAEFNIDPLSPNKLDEN